MKNNKKPQKGVTAKKIGTKLTIPYVDSRLSLIEECILEIASDLNETNPGLNIYQKMAEKLQKK